MAAYSSSSQSGAAVFSASHDVLTAASESRRPCASVALRSSSAFAASNSVDTAPSDVSSAAIGSESSASASVLTVSRSVVIASSDASRSAIAPSPAVRSIALQRVHVGAQLLEVVTHSGLIVSTASGSRGHKSTKNG